MDRKELSAESFVWRTMEGEEVTLSEMGTKHIFNCMKMIFNHLAQEFDAEPVWFNHEYGAYQQGAVEDPEGLAWQVLMFIGEIESRGDLPGKYAEPYAAICQQVFGPMKFKRLRIAAHKDVLNG